MWDGWPGLLAVRMQSEGQGSDLLSAHLALGIDLKQKLHMLKSPKLILALVQTRGLSRDHQWMVDTSFD